MNENTQLDHKTIESHKMPRQCSGIAITISPADNEQNFLEKDATKRLRSFYNKWNKLIHETLTGHKEFEFHVEISINGRLHLHGYIEVDTPIDILSSIQMLNYRYTKSGNVKPNDINVQLNRIKDTNNKNISDKGGLGGGTPKEIWLNYIRKDYPIMKSKISSNPSTYKSIKIIEDTKQSPLLEYMRISPTQCMEEN